jgi:hypothetical protein
MKVYSPISEKTNKLGKQGKEYSIDFPKTMLYASFELPNAITASLFYGIIRYRQGITLTFNVVASYLVLTLFL